MERFVAIIGLMMALTLVLANQRLRNIGLKRVLAFSVIWIGIIALAAMIFRGFRA